MACAISGGIDSSLRERIHLGCNHGPDPRCHGDRRDAHAPKNAFRRFAKPGRTQGHPSARERIDRRGGEVVSGGWVGLTSPEYLTSLTPLPHAYYTVMQVVLKVEHISGPQ